MVLEEQIKVIIHIQNILPIPPVYKDIATPESEPTPIRDASEMHNEENEDIPSSFLVITFNALIIFKCLNFNLIEKYTPDIINTIIPSNSTISPLNYMKKYI